MGLSTIELVGLLGAHLNTDAGVVAHVGEGGCFHAKADADQPCPFMLYAIPRTNLRDSQGLGEAQESGQVADATVMLSVITQADDPPGAGASWLTRPTLRSAHGHQAAGRFATSRPSKRGQRATSNRDRPCKAARCGTTSSWSEREHAWDSNGNLREGSHRRLPFLCTCKKRRGRVFAVSEAVSGTEFVA